MKRQHDETEFNPENENYINMPEVKSVKNFCFICRQPGPSKKGYQVKFFIMNLAPAFGVVNYTNDHIPADPYQFETWRSRTNSKY